MRRTIFAIFFMVSFFAVNVTHAAQGQPQGANWQKKQEAEVVLAGNTPDGITPTESRTGENMTEAPGDLFPQAPKAPEKVVPSRQDIRGNVKAIDNTARSFNEAQQNLLIAEQELQTASENLTQAKAERDAQVDVELEQAEKELADAELRKENRKNKLADTQSQLAKMTLDLYMMGPPQTVDFTSMNVLDSYRVNQTLLVGVTNTRSEVARLKQKVVDADKDIIEQQAKVVEAKLAVEAADADILKYSENIDRASNEIENQKQNILTYEQKGSQLQQTVASQLRETGSPSNTAKNPLVSIMGESALTAEELSLWFFSVKQTLQVGENNIPELAEAYITEGESLGVRGDVAFIQAVIETGYFQYTGKNNFAGIGHCDACQRGYPFETPQLGVRAQIQLLRSYADERVRAKDFPGGALPGVNPDSLGVRGCCYSWWGLSGVWASALHYGGTILELYESAVKYTQRVSAGSQTSIQS